MSRALFSLKFGEIKCRNINVNCTVYLIKYDEIINEEKISCYVPFTGMDGLVEC